MNSVSFQHACWLWRVRSQSTQGENSSYIRDGKPYIQQKTINSSPTRSVGPSILTSSSSFPILYLPFLLPINFLSLPPSIPNLLLFATVRCYRMAASSWVVRTQRLPCNAPLFFSSYSFRWIALACLLLLLLYKNLNVRAKCKESSIFC